MSESMEIMPEVVHGSALEQLTRGEVDIQIATAKRYPRNLTRCVDELVSMATIDADTAMECYYTLPRAGKQIEGPSIRLAELALSTWTNVLGGSRVLEIGDQYVVAQGVFWDLEKNVRYTNEVRRRITDKNGKRYSEDMIVTTANAACAIAVRNAVFKGIPQAIWKQAYKAAQETAVGTQKTLGTRRDKMVDYFTGLGVSEERICAVVNRQAIEEITLKDLKVLIGLASAIRDGDTTAEQAFPELQGDRLDKATERLAKAREKQRNKAERPRPTPEVEPEEKTPGTDASEPETPDTEPDEDLPYDEEQPEPPIQFEEGTDSKEREPVTENEKEAAQARQNLVDKLGRLKKAQAIKFSGACRGLGIDPNSCDKADASVLRKIAEAMAKK